jgi:hypothetical protein
MQAQNAAADYHFIYNSVINKSVEAFEIFFFKNVSSEVYGRSSLGYQATNDIVQNPVQEESYPPKLFSMWTIYLFDHTSSISLWTFNVLRRISLPLKTYKQ